MEDDGFDPYDVYFDCNEEPEEENELDLDEVPYDKQITALRRTIDRREKAMIEAEKRLAELDDPDEKMECRKAVGFFHKQRDLCISALSCLTDDPSLVAGLEPYMDADFSFPSWFSDYYRSLPREEQMEELVATIVSKRLHEGTKEILSYPVGRTAINDAGFLSLMRDEPRFWSAIGGLILSDRSLLESYIDALGERSFQGGHFEDMDMYLELAQMYDGENLAGDSAGEER